MPRVSADMRRLDAPRRPQTGPPLAGPCVLHGCTDRTRTCAVKAARLRRRHPKPASLKLYAGFWFSRAHASRNHVTQRMQRMPYRPPPPSGRSVALRASRQRPGRSVPTSWVPWATTRPSAAHVDRAPARQTPFSGPSRWGASPHLRVKTPPWALGALPGWLRGAMTHRGSHAAVVGAWGALT